MRIDRTGRIAVLLALAIALLVPGVAGAGNLSALKAKLDSPVRALVEPDDDFAGATAINALPGEAVTVSDTLSEEDYLDIWKVRLVKGQVLSTSVTAADDAYVWQVMFEPGATLESMPIAFGDSPEGDYPLTTRYQARFTGDHYIMVLNEDIEMYDYDLTVRVFNGTSVSINTPPKVIPYNGAANITGAVTRLVSGDDTPPAGTVELQRSANGKTWMTISSAALGADGAYAFTAKDIKIKTYFRVKYGATDGLHGSSVSAAKAYLPRALVGSPYGSGTQTLGRATGIAGSLYPRHVAGTRAVKLTCMRLERRNGKAVYVTRMVAYAKVTNDGDHSKYLARIKLPYRGTYRIRATHEDAGHFLTRGYVDKTVVVR